MEIYNGQYKVLEVFRMAPYFLKMIKKNKDIDLITIEEGINHLIKHFPLETARILTSINPKTIENIYETLEHLDVLENRKVDKQYGESGNRFRRRSDNGVQYRRPSDDVYVNNARRDRRRDTTTENYQDNRGYYRDQANRYYKDEQDHTAYGQPARYNRRIGDNRQWGGNDRSTDASKYREAHRMTSKEHKTDEESQYKRNRYNINSIRMQKNDNNEDRQVFEEENCENSEN